MRVTGLILLLLSVVGAFAHSFHGPSGIDDLKAVFGLSSELKEWNRDTFVSIASRLSDHLESYLTANGIKTEHLNDVFPGPEFKWVPLFVDSVLPDGSVAQWQAPCFHVSQATVSMEETQAVITFTANNASSALCSDFYLISSLENIHFLELKSAGTHTLTWQFRKDITAAEMDDLKRNGFRINRFIDTPLGCLYDLYQTVMLFLPAMTHGAGVPEACEKHNVQFLQKFVDIVMQPRSVHLVNISEDIIQSGDFFGIVRLDGLDPMLAWAMGAHTGHTTVALRNNGKLYVCESTTNSNYWPTNGIQCTPYQTWLNQAVAASHNVVYLPLSPQMRAKFNEQRAWDFFQQNAGLDYGFGNMLFAWIDTLEDNYPFPLTSHVHMLLPALIERLGLKVVADLMWNRGFNLRLGTKDLPAAQLYQIAATQGMGFSQLMALPEQDKWLYTQKHNNGSTVEGRSMVCDVFVCEMWRAGGLFDDIGFDFQCTEATNFDIYSLNIFDGAFQRPAECVAADPTLPYCQLTGNYRIELPFWNSRPVTPNAWNTCPRGNPPDFNKPLGC